MNADVIPGARLRALESGMTDLLEKPLARTLVWQCLSRYLKTAPEEISRPSRGVNELMSWPVIAGQDLAQAKNYFGDKPAMYKSFLLKFLNHNERRCEALETLRRAPNMGALIEEVHQLRGSAALLGLTRLSALATQVEDAYRSRQQLDEPTFSDFVLHLAETLRELRYLEAGGPSEPEGVAPGTLWPTI